MFILQSTDAARDRSFSIDRNDYHISWDAITAWVCEQCGESLFEMKEVDAIQEALTVLDHEIVALASN